MKSWGRWMLLLVFAGLLTGPALAAAEDEQESTSKGFWIENTTVDLGKVRAGEDAEAVFVFHNDTEKDVQIIRAKPS